MGLKEALDFNTYYSAEELCSGSNCWIIKISGLAAFKVVDEFVREGFLASSKPVMYDFFHPQTSRFLFKAKLMSWDSVESFTGEKFLEIHFASSEIIKNRFCDLLTSIGSVKKGTIFNFLEQRQKNDVQNSFQDKAVEVLSRSKSDKEKLEAIYFLTANFEELYSNWFRKLKELNEILESKNAIENDAKEFIQEIDNNINLINSEIARHMQRVSDFHCLIIKNQKQDFPNGDVYKTILSIMGAIKQEVEIDPLKEVALSIGRLKKRFD